MNFHLYKIRASYFTTHLHQLMVMVPLTEVLKHVSLSVIGHPSPIKPVALYCLWVTSKMLLLLLQTFSKTAASIFATFFGCRI